MNRILVITGRTELEPYPNVQSGGEWAPIATYPEDGLGYQIYNVSFRAGDRFIRNAWVLILEGVFLIPFLSADRPGDLTQSGWLTHTDLGIPGQDVDWVAVQRDVGSPQGAGSELTQQVSEIAIGKVSFEHSRAEKLAMATGGRTATIGAPPPFPLHSARTSSGQEAYFRFSAFFPDNRVNPATGDFAPGTYATPYSDIRLVPSGYAAVGRYALPSPLPHTFVYAHVCTRGTPMIVGATLPLFGQAGGGVEVLFPNGSSNCPGHPHRVQEL